MTALDTVARLAATELRESVTTTPPPIAEPSRARRARRPVRRMAVAFAAVAVCIALIAGGLALWQRPATVDPASELLSGWIRIPAEEAGLEDAIAPVGLAAISDGFVLAGSYQPESMQGRNDSFWWSADGRAWRRVSSPALSGISVIHSMTGFAGRAVAIATVNGQPGPMLLTSSDGRSWVRSPLDLPLPDTTLPGVTDTRPPRVMVQRIASGEIGLLVSGFVQIDEQPRGPLSPGSASTGSASRFISAIWRSTDGSTWDLLPESVEDDRQILALATAPERSTFSWVSVEMLRGGGSAIHIGQSFQVRVLSDAGLIRGPSFTTNLAVTSLVQLRDGRTLVGFTDDKATYVRWVERDGSDTPEAELAGLLGLGSIVLTGDQPVVVASGLRSDEERTPELWVRTPEGWRRADLGIAPEVLGHLGPAAAGHGAVLAIGQIPDGGLDVYRWEGAK